MRDAFVRALTTLAERDERVILITGDLGFGVLDDFARRFPAQYVNAGVAEQNMAALACGLALEGRQAYIYSIANFSTLRCLEQIRNDICYHRADVKVVSVGGGFSYGSLGMSHFATEDLAILRALPNMKVVVPTDPWEAGELTLQIAATPGPAYLRLDKGTAGLSPALGETLLGRARIVREGDALTVVATGAILREALVAAERLQNEGIGLRVLAVHTLKPLDNAALVNAAKETGGIVTLEEHTVLGGLGGAVAEALLEAGAPPRRFRRIGLADRFPEVVGTQDYLRGAYDMGADTVVTVVRELLGAERSDGFRRPAA